MIVTASLSIEGILSAVFIEVTHSVLILQLGVLRRLAAVCDVLRWITKLCIFAV